VDVTVIVGTFGDEAFAELARTRAVPSAADQAPTVHFHLDEDTGGYGAQLSECRNRPARAARTEWLCFLDSDDELAPGFIDAMSDAAGDLLTPAVSYLWPGRPPSAPGFWPEQDIRDGNWLIVTTLIRRTLFLELGGFRDVPMYEDWDLWQRCLNAGAVVTRVPRAVCRVHVRPDSLHRNGSSRRQKRVAHETVRRLNYPELYA
jgi:glycosyltransferase involved in cell wall biosynthesis